MKSKMFEIRDAVMGAVQDGSNSSRIVQINIDSGKLSLDTSSIPISCGQARNDNGILFEMDTSERIVASSSWILADPFENETGDLCTKGGPGVSYPGVLFARSTGQEGMDRYMTQYLISFRNLKDMVNNQHHFIKIGTSEIGNNSSAIGEGTHNLMILNKGSTFDESALRWTHEITVIFDP
jgi:hypothetical protein|tara:strand:- start:2139 stop:2681 length:543 start_codon:yes stop_codon:yes gene_type:complete